MVTPLGKSEIVFTGTNTNFHIYIYMENTFIAFGLGLNAPPQLHWSGAFNPKPNAMNVFSIYIYDSVCTSEYNFTLP